MKKATSQIFPEKRVIPGPPVTDLVKGRHIFMSYSRFLGFTDERAAKLLQGQKAYISTDAFLSSLGRREINAELELDAVLRTL